MTRAAIYTRISSDPDDTRKGVERQRADCLRIAAEFSWTIVAEYEDNNISAAKGSKKEREQYLRLLADIQAGKIDAVVIWMEDRLQRQLLELEEFLRACEKAGVTKLASAGGEFDISDPDQRLTLRLRLPSLRQRLRRSGSDFGGNVRRAPKMAYATLEGAASLGTVASAGLLARMETGESCPLCRSSKHSPNNSGFKRQPIGCSLVTHSGGSALIGPIEAS